ncbi:GAL4-like Zn(II)2Cys6 (or C6 zinc) binuclear cluster DNA-binding domain [Rhizoctonia solani]|uniref:GAL4-like Zn(II)2Cys6 (Or C6 zinc) binuclear cluster DNA-binding domain n=1 Tax=Rhizoctonia solani TaxID=456999 RepID=A0A8H7HFB5_9AGAM|nr:GAL4-like Zn(II)2Cys6 (or C6 zinc) binuclear cluster DNA-binding domain [Rhizoctonia solani]
MYSSPASSLSSPSLSSPDTASLPDTPPVQSTTSLPLLPPPLITAALLDQSRPKRDCRPFPPMTVLDHTGPPSPMDQRPYISRRVSYPSLPPPPPRIDPYLLPSISSLMLAPASPWDYSAQLQFALNSAQTGPYLHPFGRGHQHYQAHMQPGGHIIPGVGVGAGMGRDLEHHHPGEHSLAGLLGGNRKRPKYTRSKTGCLTCRTKKIKCDETKPICTKCVHGQRECTWPKDVQVNPSATSSAPSSRPSPTTSTPQRSPSRPGPSSDLSRSNSANGRRAGSNFLSSSERGSSSAGTPSRETSPQERLDSHTRNSTESRTPGLLVPHSGSSLSGLTSGADPLSFPQPLDMTSFGNSGVDSFPLSAQFGSLPMGYSDQLSMLNQPLSVDNPASYSPWGPSSYGNGSSPIDTSTANGQWSATSNQLLTNPDPIAPFFRSVQERNLVLVSPSSYY